MTRPRILALAGAVAGLLSGCATDCDAEPRATIELTDADGAPVDDAFVECAIDGVPQVVTTAPGLAWCVAAPGTLELTVEWRGAIVELPAWNVVERPDECPPIPSQVHEVVLVE